MDMGYVASVFRATPIAQDFDCNFFTVFVFDANEPSCFGRIAACNSVCLDTAFCCFQEKSLY